VRVRSTRAVAPGSWYRAQCTRDGNTLTLKVVRLEDRASWSYRASGATGRLQPSSRTVPLSVGGKLRNGGNPAASADQFNGRVDNVVYNVF
jgi:hypothetical protein